MAEIGLIGAGLMGRGIGANLLRKGHKLGVVAHHNREGVEQLLAQGAKEYQSNRELAAGSEIVLVCVTGSPAFQSVAEGERGFIAGLSPGTCVLDCTTGDADVVAAYDKRFAGLGVGFADGPLARTPVEAAAGKLNVMVGATPELFARLRPVLEAFCENIFHVGAVGSGTRMKLINNLVTMGQASLIAEAISACKGTGVDLQVFYDIISKGGGNSGIFQMIVPGVLKGGDYDGMKFSIANATKDLGYYRRMSAAAGLAAPMGAAVHERLVEAGQAGFADELVGHLVAASLKANGLLEETRPVRELQGT